MKKWSLFEASINSIELPSKKPTSISITFDGMVNVFSSWHSENSDLSIVVSVELFSNTAFWMELFFKQCSYMILTLEEIIIFLSSWYSLNAPHSIISSLELFSNSMFLMELFLKQEFPITLTFAGIRIDSNLTQM